MLAYKQVYHVMLISLTELPNCVLRSNRYYGVNHHYRALIEPLRVQGKVFNNN